MNRRPRENCPTDASPQTAWKSAYPALRLSSCARSRPPRIVRCAGWLGPAGAASPCRPQSGRPSTLHPWPSSRATSRPQSQGCVPWARCRPAWPTAQVLGFGAVPFVQATADECCETAPWPDPAPSAVGSPNGRKTRVRPIRYPSDPPPGGRSPTPACAARLHGCGSRSSPPAWPRPGTPPPAETQPPFARCPGR